MQGKHVPRIVVITGPAGSRKTALCLRIADVARKRGLSVRGLVSPPRLAGDTKVGIDVLDVSNGERRALAESRTATDGPATQSWHFHADGLAWGVGVLQHSLPCDLLLLDELGPLELLRGTGWVVAIDLVRSGDYRWGVVVVRPRLSQRFLDLVPAVQTTVFSVTPEGQDGALKQIARLWEDDSVQGGQE
jgi:nucleoside-triphosphatase